ncbi:MAG: DUF4118 domain-containing protein [Kineosporiaceae bacterium]
MSHGRLRVYLGVAPGAGSTHALLDEAHRRADRGTDVVLAAVDTHRRARLDQALDGVELVGDGSAIDVAAVLARRPAVVFVDDLQRPNPDGADRAWRWQDVEYLLAAGLDVVATVDVRHIASLADVVRAITGTDPGGAVPDRLVREADQLQLVDIPPHALRRRLAHGGLLTAEQLDARRAAGFRPEVLAALREVAFTWAAGAIARQHLAHGERPPGLDAQLAAIASPVATPLDIQVAIPGDDARVAIPRLQRGLSGRRLGVGTVLALGLPSLATLALRAAGTWAGLAMDSLLLLLTVVITALVGGLWPALLGAVLASTLLNYFFIPPVYTFRVGEPHNVITLIMFLLVASLVSTVVHRAATQAGRASRAAAESRSLATLAEEVLRSDEALPALLEHLRTAFGMTSASLLEQSGTPTWQLVAGRGPQPPSRPEEAEVTVPAGDHLMLALAGRSLAAGDRTLLRAFAAQAQGLLERDRLARAAAQAARLEAGQKLRDALLGAVGHDLRTPLAAARAAVSSLQSSDVTWAPAERQELLDTAGQSLERLGRLVADLLDLSRLRAGALTVTGEPVWLEDLVPPALDEVGPGARDVRLHLAEDLPAVMADGALLTRALVNVITNAVRHSPADAPPVVAVSSVAGQVEVRVIDRGPGVPEQERSRMFVPFQRLGDTDNSTGLGLGLAVSRGLVEAMGGTLEVEDTPGGGLTMVLSLPAAPADLLAVEPGRRERGEPT